MDERHEHNDKTLRLREMFPKLAQRVLDSVVYGADNGIKNATGIYDSSLLLNFTAEGGEHYSAYVIIRDHARLDELGETLNIFGEKRPVIGDYPGEEV